MTLKELAAAVNGTIAGASDTAISDLSGLEEAGPTDLAYITGDGAMAAARASRAAAFVVARPLAELDRPQLIVANPAYAAARIVREFFGEPRVARGIAEAIVRGRDVEIGREPSIWPFVTLGDGVVLGDRVSLYPGVFIGADCVVGDDCILYPNVTLLERCRLGRRVIVHSGTVIGADGFGFTPHEGRHEKIPQRGGVVIEDDVELGANVTIDRATFGNTVVGQGSKVDNQVHIAHNVTIGAHAILVAQVGIGGSTTLGRHVIVGGQTGIGDHVRIGDAARVAAGSGVLQDVPDGEMVGGTPALPLPIALRAYGLIRHLPDIHRQLQQLQKRLDALGAPPPRRRASGRRRKR